jgi:hypothetical protein
MTRTPDHLRSIARADATSAALTTFEQRLDQDSRWALTQGSIFFEGGGEVQKSLRKITAKLSELNIPYAVVGGMALFNHGVRRFTEDVDILVTTSGLRQIHDQLEGLGYLAPFAGSKNLRDTETGVKIEFLIAGQFPGDGKEKPVAFPNPADAAVAIDGIQFINLRSLIELKIASGVTGSNRAKDLVDVAALIRELSLPLSYADELNPYVREEYRRQWTTSHRRYVKILARQVSEVEQNDRALLLERLRREVAGIDQMIVDGAVIEVNVRGSRTRAIAVVDNPQTALKYDMHDENDLWDED